MRGEDEPVRDQAQDGESKKKEIEALLLEFEDSSKEESPGPMATLDMLVDVAGAGMPELGKAEPGFRRSQAIMIEDSPVKREPLSKEEAVDRLLAMAMEKSREFGKPHV